MPFLSKFTLAIITARRGRLYFLRQGRIRLILADYVIRFKCVEGVRFLLGHEGIYCFAFSDCIPQSKADTKFRFIDDDRNCYRFALLLLETASPYFLDVFDPYHLLDEYSWLSPALFENEAIVDAALKNPRALQRELHFREGKPKEGRGWRPIYLNPWLSRLLRRALVYNDKCEQQALDILRFGLEHNEAVIDNVIAALKEEGAPKSGGTISLYGEIKIGGISYGSIIHHRRIPDWPMPEPIEELLTRLIHINSKLGEYVEALKES